MRAMTGLTCCDGFSISEVRIRADSPGWLADEIFDQVRLVFVRRGTYRLLVAGLESLVDPTVAYVTRPGDPQRIAHKAGVTDLCTSITLSPEFIAATGAQMPARSWVGPTTGTVDLAQRALVARARRGADEFELTERLSNLWWLLGSPAARAAEDSGRSVRTRQKIVDIARELLTEDPATLRLTDLAAHAGASQYYLSRAFRQATGDTLSKFRNRLRVRQALERIEAGESDLARLAADLGFSDHAHLTRTIRDEVSGTPTIVRQIFAGTLDAAR